MFNNNTSSNLNGQIKLSKGSSKACQAEGKQAKQRILNPRKKAQQKYQLNRMILMSNCGGKKLKYWTY